MVESLPALMATIFANLFLFPKKSWKIVDRKTNRNRTKGNSEQKADSTIGFAPKFCAKWSGRELPSSHGDYFRELFGFLLRGSVSGRSLWEVSGESLGGFNNYSVCKKFPKTSEMLILLCVFEGKCHKLLFFTIENGATIACHNPWPSLYTRP